MENKIKPTHDLLYLNKLTNERGRLGAGWQNEDGSISIRLNPKVVLSQDNKVDVITLFRVKEHTAPPTQLPQETTNEPLTTQTPFEQLQKVARAKKQAPF